MSSRALLVLRLCVGGVLCWAGGSKLTAVASFAESIANYRILPAQANQLLAAVIPWWEVVAGLLLVFGVWVRPAAMLAVAMFSLFGLAVSSALARGLDIDCGCFGTAAGGRVGVLTLFVDLICATAGALLFRLAGPGEPPPTPSPSDSVREQAERQAVQ